MLQTSSFVTTFILAMALYPELAKRAQAEMEVVVGSDQLPNLNHRQALPFVDALVQETMRSFPPLPLGMNFTYELPGITHIYDI